MQFPFFDPRHPACKQPYGAVPCGTVVTLCLHPFQQEDFVLCTLLCWQDFAGQELELSDHGAPFPPYHRFSLHWEMPAVPELLWYGFRLTRRDGSCLYLGKNGFCHKPEQLARWQLTVYAPSHTPTWFGEGVTYQIFPDRFHRLVCPNPQGLVGNRSVHRDWDEPMVYLPNEEGRITNSDFFGGSLSGIQAKLPYLQQLGVTTLYLCPIFESASNHRYDTADYRRIDPMLGTNDAFSALCTAAKELGMRIVLDGVFNHTGSNSRYFNRDGFYDTVGAFQSPDSPYYNWYCFQDFPTQYDAWWGIDTLPAVNESSQEYVDFLTGEDGIVRHWMRLGASGWRLDVADELTDPVLDALRRAVETENPDAILLGEVWEDGSNKIAYSRRRRYLLGQQCHSLMNYPFRTATLAWLLGGDASEFVETMETLRENYPPSAFYSAMNFLGTHDTARILTVLGCAVPPSSRTERANYRLSPTELRLGQERLALAAMLLYTFPGSPTLFYGDEVGMQGFEDPFNRGTFPWGNEDAALLSLFTRLGQLRKTQDALKRGSIEYLFAEGGTLVFRRRWQTEEVLTVLHAGDAPFTLSLPSSATLLHDAVSLQDFLPQDGVVRLTLAPRDGVVLVAKPTCFM